MRWSPLVTLFIVLALTSIIEGVFAAPLNVVLESRAKAKQEVQSAKSNKRSVHGSSKKSPSNYHSAAHQTNAHTTKSKPPTAGPLKKSPSNYHNAAHRTNALTTKSKPPTAGPLKTSPNYHNAAHRTNAPTTKSKPPTAGPLKTSPSNYHNAAHRTNALTTKSKPPTAGPLKSKPLTAASLKKSSSTYRHDALKRRTFTKSKAGRGKITELKTPKAPPKGFDADHILEAQTVAKALHKAGYKTTDRLGAQALHAVKDTLNHHRNMAFVDADVNQAKGRAQRTALSGKNPNASSHVKDYMEKTAKAGKDTAKQIDKVLRQHGVTGVSVQNEHLAILHKMKIKRELSLEELD